MKKTNKFLAASLLFLSTLLLSFQTIVLGQQTDNWYFGSAAGFPNTGLRVSFTSGTPVVSTGNPMLTEEGSSSISDASGNPLFYTDGVTVWDASTNIAFGTGLNGGASSTQSAIIMPRPGAINQWLLFTSGTQGNPGVNYYTVSGTPGAFTISGSTTLVAAGIVGEGLCIVGNSTVANAFWVVSRTVDLVGQVRSFAVSAAGVVNPALITSTLFATLANNTSYTSNIGTIKSNTCQNKIAFTYLNGDVDIADFNASTGQVVAGTAIRINVPSTGGNSGSYGIEFSTNDAYLYITNLSSGQIHRYNVATNAVALFGSVAAGNEAGQLQAAPDGNIYFANRNASPATAPNYLGVITNPGAAGAGFNAQAVLLSDVLSGGNFGFVYRGLPTFPKSLVVSSLNVLPGDGQYCTGVNIPLSYLFSGTLQTLTTVAWTSLDPGQTFTPGGASSTSNTPSVSFSTIGTKRIVLEFRDFCGRLFRDTTNFIISAPKNPTGTIVCSGNNLILNNPAVDPDEPNYIWYRNSVSDANIIGTGTPFNYVVGQNASLPSQICLGVASGTPTVSTGANSIASSNLLGGAAEVTPKTSSTFDVLADQLVLKSYRIGFRFAGTYSITTTIRDGSNAVVFTQTASTGPVAAGANLPIPVNTTLPRGNGYTITVSTPSPGEQLQRAGWTGATNANQIRYNAVASPGTASIADLQYDFYNFTATPVCSTPLCIPVACTLPIELIRFDGAASEQQTVLLNWATISEQNNAYFEIHHSSNGITFSSIVTTAGGGNTDGLREYTFTHNQPSNGINYYKLVQYDYNGNSSSSKVIAVTIANPTIGFSVYPNPSSGEFTLSFSDNTVGKLSVLNALGVIVLEKTISLQTENLELGAGFAKGVYLLKFTTNFGSLLQRIVKE